MRTVEPRAIGMQLVRGDYRIGLDSILNAGKNSPHGTPDAAKVSGRIQILDVIDGLLRSNQAPPFAELEVAVPFAAVGVFTSRGIGPPRGCP